LSQLQQAVVALPGGGFGVVWEEGLWPERNVRMQWLDRAGRARFAPGGKLIGGQAGEEADAVIAAHPSGGAYVAFNRGNGIVAQYFDADGQPQWPGDGVPVTEGAFLRIFNPHIVANPAGGAFVCFQVFDDLFGTIDIRCQHIDSTGLRRWPSTGASVGDGGSDELRAVPRGLSDGAGGLMVFWRNQRGLTTPVGPMLMEGQRFGPDGQKLWGAMPKVVRTTQLAPDNGYSFTFFQVVSDGSGGAVLAFNDWIDQSDFHLDVMAQRVSGAGDLLWGSGAVVTGAIGHQQHEQTIATGDGGAFVAVYDELSWLHNRLLLFRLGPDGTHVWPSTGLLLSDPGATASDYSVFGSFDDGALRVGWTHQNLPYTFEMDVQLAMFAPDGLRLGGTLLTQASDAQFLHGLAYSPEFGGFLGVWDDRRKGTWDDVDVMGGLFKESIACPIGDFYTLTPCRLLDTRLPGGSPLTSLQTRTFIASGACGIPASATAIAANVTVVSPSGPGYLTLYPAGHPKPLASTINFQAGQTRANNAVLGLSFTGAFAASPLVSGAGSVHLVIDVSGYFN
jgi:hypothetical protein